MVDEVVNLVVAVNERATILRLCIWISQEGNNVLEMWDIAHKVFVFHVDCLGLRARYGAESLQLSVVEARVLPKTREVHRVGVDPVHFANRSDRIVPHVIPLVCRHTGKRRVLKYSPVQEFHDVEWRPNH